MIKTAINPGYGCQEENVQLNDTNHPMLPNTEIVYYDSLFYISKSINIKERIISSITIHSNKKVEKNYMIFLSI